MEKLSKEMGLIAQSGRSTAGDPQKNNVKKPNEKVLNDVIFPEVYVERFPSLGVHKK